MTQIAVGLEEIKELLVGEMGIKDVVVGDAPVHTRQGGYFYLELTS